MGSVLRGIAGLSLLSRVVDMVTAVLNLKGIAGFGITSAFVDFGCPAARAVVWSLLAPSLIAEGQRVVKRRVSSICGRNPPDARRMLVRMRNRAPPRPWEDYEPLRFLP